MNARVADETFQCPYDLRAFIRDGTELGPCEEGMQNSKIRVFELFDLQSDWVRRRM